MRSNWSPRNTSQRKHKAPAAACSHRLDLVERSDLHHIRVVSRELKPDAPVAPLADQERVQLALLALHQTLLSIHQRAPAAEPGLDQAVASLVGRPDRGDQPELAYRLGDQLLMDPLAHHGPPPSSVT